MLNSNQMGNRKSVNQIKLYCPLRISFELPLNSNSLARIKSISCQRTALRAWFSSRSRQSNPLISDIELFFYCSLLTISDNSIINTVISRQSKWLYMYNSLLPSALLQNWLRCYLLLSPSKWSCFEWFWLGFDIWGLLWCSCSIYKL
jgi:hypothetical protein